MKDLTHYFQSSPPKPFHSSNSPDSETPGPPYSASETSHTELKSADCEKSECSTSLEVKEKERTNSSNVEKCETEIELVEDDTAVDGPKKTSKIASGKEVNGNMSEKTHSNKTNKLGDPVAQVDQCDLDDQCGDECTTGDTCSKEKDSCAFVKKSPNAFQILMSTQQTFNSVNSGKKESIDEVKDGDINLKKENKKKIRENLELMSKRKLELEVSPKSSEGCTEKPVKKKRRIIKESDSEDENDRQKKETLNTSTDECGKDKIKKRKKPELDIIITKKQSHVKSSPAAKKCVSTSKEKESSNSGEKEIDSIETINRKDDSGIKNDKSSKNEKIAKRNLPKVNNKDVKQEDSNKLSRNKSGAKKKFANLNKNKTVDKELSESESSKIDDLNLKKYDSKEKVIHKKAEELNNFIEKEDSGDKLSISGSDIKGNNVCDPTADNNAPMRDAKKEKTSDKGGNKSQKKDVSLKGKKKEKAGIGNPDKPKKNKENLSSPSNLNPSEKIIEEVKNESEWIEVTKQDGVNKGTLKASSIEQNLDNDVEEVLESPDGISKKNGDENKSSDGHDVRRKSNILNYFNKVSSEEKKRQSDKFEVKVDVHFPVNTSNNSKTPVSKVKSKKKKKKKKSEIVDDIEVVGSELIDKDVCEVDCSKSNSGDCSVMEKKTDEEKGTETASSNLTSKSPNLFLSSSWKMRIRFSDNGSDTSTKRAKKNSISQNKKKLKLCSGGSQSKTEKVTPEPDSPSDVDNVLDCTSLDISEKDKSNGKESSTKHESDISESKPVSCEEISSKRDSKTSETSSKDNKSKLNECGTRNSSMKQKECSKEKSIEHKSNADIASFFLFDKSPVSKEDSKVKEKSFDEFSKNSSGTNNSTNIKGVTTAKSVQSPFVEKKSSSGKGKSENSKSVSTPKDKSTPNKKILKSQKNVSTLSKQSTSSQKVSETVENESIIFENTTSSKKGSRTTRNKSNSDNKASKSSEDKSVSQKKSSLSKTDRKMQKSESTPSKKVPKSLQDESVTPKRSTPTKKRLKISQNDAETTKNATPTTKVLKIVKNESSFTKNLTTSKNVSKTLDVESITPETSIRSKLASTRKSSVKRAASSITKNTTPVKEDSSSSEDAADIETPVRSVRRRSLKKDSEPETRSPMNEVVKTGSRRALKLTSQSKSTPPAKPNHERLRLRLKRCTPVAGSESSDSWKSVSPEPEILLSDDGDDDRDEDYDCGDDGDSEDSEYDDKSDEIGDVEPILVLKKNKKKEGKQTKINDRMVSDEEILKLMAERKVIMQAIKKAKGKLAKMLASSENAVPDQVPVEKTAKKAKREPPNVKLAPLFMKCKPKKVDKASVHAKKMFLQSGVPEVIKKMVQVQTLAEELAEEHVIFPSVSHVQQKGEMDPMWKLDNVLGKFSSKVKNDELCIPRLIPVGCLTDCKSSEKMTKQFTPSRPQQIKVFRDFLRSIKAETPEFPVYRTFKALYGQNRTVPDEISNNSAKKRKRSRSSLKNKTSQDEETKVVDASQPAWHAKYKPLSSDGIVGNTQTVQRLKKWLELWIQVKKGKSFSKTEENNCLSDDDFINDGSDDDGKVPLPKNTIVITGPHGSGKTMAVYTIAHELGYKVLEVNAAAKRTGRRILSELMEATQSHQVQGKGNDITPGIKTFFAAKQKPVAKKAKQPDSELQSSKLSLILVEDVDIVFEDEDEGFVSALSTLVAGSKRPIVLVTSNPSCTHLDRFLENSLVLEFKPAPCKLVAVWLQLVCLLEGIRLKRSCMEELLLENHGDVRKTLLQVQLWVLSGGSISECQEEIPCESDLVEFPDDASNSIFVSMIDNKRDNEGSFPFHSRCLETFLESDPCLVSVNRGKLWWNIPNVLGLNSVSHSLSVKLNNINGYESDMEVDIIDGKSSEVTDDKSVDDVTSESNMEIDHKPCEESDSTNTDNVGDKSEQCSENKEDSAHKWRSVCSIEDICSMSVLADTLSVVERFSYSVAEPNFEPERCFWEQDVADSLSLNENEESSWCGVNSFTQCCGSWLVMKSVEQCADQLLTTKDRLLVSQLQRNLPEEELRWRGNQHAASLELCEAVPMVYRLDRRSLSTDYVPSLRNISRLEQDRSSASCKRNNRFCHYLRGLGVNPRSGVLNFACTAFHSNLKS